jgi:hypothetical protein
MKALLLVLFRIPAGSAQIASPPKVGDSARLAFDPAISAAAEIERALALDLGGEWCSWCRTLDALFLAHPALSEYLHDQHIAVKVNGSRENRNQEALSRHPEVSEYPHCFVLNAWAPVRTAPAQ